MKVGSCWGALLHAGVNLGTGRPLPARLKGLAQSGPGGLIPCEAEEVTLTRVRALREMG